MLSTSYLSSNTHAHRYMHTHLHTGTVDFNISRMPKPSVDASGCSLDQLPDADHDAPYDDLFKRKRMKGWWPSYEVSDEGVRELNVSVL